MTDPLPILNYQTPPEPQRQIPASWLTKIRAGAIVAIISLALQMIVPSIFPSRPVISISTLLRILGILTAWLLTSYAEPIRVSSAARWLVRVLSIVLLPVQTAMMQLLVWYYASVAARGPGRGPTTLPITNWSLWYALSSYSYILLLSVFGLFLYLCLYQTLKSLGQLALARQALALAIVLCVLYPLPYGLQIFYRFFLITSIVFLQQLFSYARYAAIAWQIVFFSFLLVRLRSPSFGWPTS